MKATLLSTSNLNYFRPCARIMISALNITLSLASFLTLALALYSISDIYIITKRLQAMKQKNHVASNKPKDDGLEKFKKNVKEFADKNAAAQAKQAQSQAEPVEAEAKPKVKGYVPQVEITLSSVQAMVSIITGRPCRAQLRTLVLPDIGLGEVTLIQSSTHGILYYRVTPDSCTCPGWYYSMQRFGVGKCKHHTEAYPEEATENARLIGEIKGDHIEGVKASSAPSSMPEKLEAVKLALHQGGIQPKSVSMDTMGHDTILIRFPYSEDPTPDQARKMDRALALGRAAAGMNDVYVSVI
jgi:hypothetical protein